MSALKSQIKIGTLRSIGVRGEELLEATQRYAFELEGGKRSLLEAKLKLLGHVKEHLSLDRLEEEGWDLEQREKIKRHFMHSVNIVDNLAEAGTVNVVAARGRADGVQRMLKLIRAEYEAEERKLEAMLAAQDEDDGERGNVVGLHPGGSIKDQRTATPDGGEDASEDGEGAETPPKAEEPSETPPKRKRKPSRKKAASATE
jgi:hypothetical protein